MIDMIIGMVILSIGYFGLMIAITRILDLSAIQSAKFIASSILTIIVVVLSVVYGMYFLSKGINAL